MSARPSPPRRAVRPKAGQPLSRHVGDDLLERIGAGEFRPGDKLPGEVELMAEYGVGRNTVREAVQGLVALRMLDVRPRRGATVLATSPDRALPANILGALLPTEVTEDLYEMRMLLETEAAALAAARATQSQLREVRHHHASYQHQMLAGRAPWEEDLKFHDALAKASGNTVLPLMLGAAADLLARDRQASALLWEVESSVAYREHDAILRAVEAGDPELARRRMTEHIRTASGYYKRVRELESKGP